MGASLGLKQADLLRRHWCPASWEVPSVLDRVRRIVRERRPDEGQGLAEYALILALIAIVAIVALIFLGTQVSGIISHVGQSM
jgi:Flp pilus assembly pilin Flp